MSDTTGWEKDASGEYCKTIDSTRFETFQADRIAPMPAAGPWRFDVESAPKDGSVVLLAWRDCLGEYQHETFRWYEDAETWMNGDGGFIDTPIAFATINPPEAKT